MVGPNSAETNDFEEAGADELVAGTTLMNGAYTIERFLNAGGFGMTYISRDSLNRRVVIKECFPGALCRRKELSVQPRSRGQQEELESVVALFVNEAKSLARLDHPGIVGVHQVFEENNTAYMALDYVSGRDLLDILLDPDTILTEFDVEDILRRLLEAIGFVHEAGILHRDISPDNILLDDEMNPVLIDFGAAREQATKAARIMSALRVVKDGYSPQEFYIAGSEQGTFSDLYSLGACFYHLITNEIPPDGQVRIAALASGEEDPYRPLVTRVDAFNKDFLGAIDKALAVLPKDRVSSAAEWLQLMGDDGTGSNRVTQLEIVRAEGGEDEAAVADAPGNDAMPAARAPITRPAPNPSRSMANATKTVAPEVQVASSPLPRLLATAAAIGAVILGVATQTDLLKSSEPEVLVQPGVTTQPELPNVSDVAGTESVTPSEPVVVPTPDTDDVAVDTQAAESTETAQPVVEAVETPVEEAFVPALASTWTLALPAGLSFEDGAGDARVQAVNGVPAQTQAEFDAAVQGSVDPGASTLIDVQVATGPSAADAVEQNLGLAVVHRSELASGIRFETSFDGSAWVTRIAAIPAGLSFDIELGDQVVALLNTNQLIDQAGSMQSVLEGAISDPGGTVVLAVKRDEVIWAVDMPVAELTAGATE